MWNTEKLYRWAYLQSLNRDIDSENRRMDTRGERGWDKIRDWDEYIYTIMYKIDN